MREALSEFKLNTGYLKYDPSKGRKETWHEAISDRVMLMHYEKYKQYIDNPTFKEMFYYAEQAYLDKLVLGSQRALQFGGEPILKKNSKMYNCLTSYCDRVPFFRESMWWLLSGCGVGFSVLNRFVSKLPTLKARMLGTKTYVVEDSIEGWADAVGVLLASYLHEDNKFKDYYGYEVRIDLSHIRDKGAPISSGFKAPGPEPLRIALEKIENLIEEWIRVEGKTVRPILAYDIVMHLSNAVLAGGVRRSATLCLFDKDDMEMRNAKTGNWYIDNPQRARSNNSVALLRNETSLEEFTEIMRSTEQFGEPGFVWLDDMRIVYNPCVEIGMCPYLVDNQGNEISGWQGCNLTELSGSACKNRETFLRACRASAILGTLQAGYTSFEYVGRVTEEIFRKESLLGCSITGWMSNPDVLFDETLLAEGVALIKETNEKLAAIIGINPAARLTCGKPGGNGPVVLGSASGMKPEESEKYIRYVQVNNDEYGIEHFQNINPESVEQNVWDETGLGLNIGFTVENKPGTLYKKDIYGTKHLDYVKKAIKWWVEPGTVLERCTLPTVRHNISCTINVDNWSEVTDYIYANREYFAGISFLAMDGSLEYNQAPFSEVHTAQELLNLYGEGVIMASGLIVDGLSAFDEDLWKACMHVLDRNIPVDGSRAQKFFKKDWIRRANKFARNYFKGDKKKLTYALKDVHRFYRFNTIKKSYKPINWAEYFEVTDGVDVDTLGSASCVGNKCEI